MDNLLQIRATNSSSTASNHALQNITRESRRLLPLVAVRVMFSVVSVIVCSWEGVLIQGPAMPPPYHTGIPPQPTIQGHPGSSPAKPPGHVQTCATWTTDTGTTPTPGRVQTCSLCRLSVCPQAGGWHLTEKPSMKEEKRQRNM